MAAPGRTVIYRTKMVKGPNRNFQVYDPLDFLAAVTAHIPDRGEHLVRYYGWYSSVRRGRRRRLGLEEPATAAAAIADNSPSGKEARRCWSWLIRKILQHLRLWEERSPRAPPPVPVQIDIEYQPFLEG